MAKTAALSIRIKPKLKGQLEDQAKKEGRSLASYVERVLEIHTAPPKLILRDCQSFNRKETGPRVHLPLAEGWPGALITPEHAEALAKQLIQAAKQSRAMPPAE
jgi:hypothetical protein